MTEIRIHRDAEKAFDKAPKNIRRKVLIFLRHLRDVGTTNPPYRIKPMHGEFKGYYEAVIDKDYRIIFRKANGAFFIRYAGTHNALGTG